MAYMIPFSLALPPTEKTVNARGLILSDEQDVPDDSYQFLEWYCPNPSCDCFQVQLKVFAIRQDAIAAYIYVPFGPAGSPFLDPVEPVTPTALALLKIVTEHLQEDPVYLKRLQDHYWQVRSVASNPNHPAHLAVTQWAANGAAVPTRKPSQKKR